MEQLTKTQSAILSGVSVYHANVKSVSDGMAKSERVIKKSTNAKLGKRVTRGKYKGMPIFTVTLEERATCPRSCVHWSDCYGNNMPFATRYNSGTDLESAIEIELEELQKKHPRGFLVRLHVLGDFYSVAYVAKWAKWLGMFPALHVYGYTANQPDAIEPTERAIALAVLTIRNETAGRFAVRFSGSFNDDFSALSADNPAALDLVDQKRAFVCPTQITRENPRQLAKKGEETIAASCGDCGLCWASKKPVVFLTH